MCLATDTWEEHLRQLRLFFQIVINANLKLKSEKCLLGASSCLFLGHQLSAEGIKQDPAKMAAIRNLESPRDLHELRRALGLLSYYRKFLPNFAALASPLMDLTRKAVKFVSTSKEELAFRNLISSLLNHATLTHLDPEAPITVKTDASRSGIAGMLLQRRDDEERLVACCSRRLRGSEVNYGVTDLEGLAVIYTLDKMRNYLVGRPFTLLVDHCALCVLNKKVPNSPRLKRWAALLSEFDFKIIYVKGSLHKDVDCLSRAPVDNAIDEYVEKRIFHISRPVDEVL